MSPRPPSAPPAITGFDYVRLLGSGGFADVFLYQQQHPRRQVAVKVLLKERMDAATARGFTDEADLMAQLATHPSIVSVFQAGVADDGRPYLVMEFCSKPNLQVRHRRERFSEAETLRVGVQIAGAVETAHRAGILHRDIKPANILVTDYGRPALTDFGISSTSNSEMAGMSIPWSPPEAFRTPPAGYPSSDVYALAATLYTLLTDRTPFQVPGSPNSEIDVISRIQSAPVPPIGRTDVSASLEAVLTRAMSKRPDDRYASAIEFARALQRVQIELGMQATTVDVVEEELALDDEDDDEGRTRFRGITSIAAQAEPLPPGAWTTAPGAVPAGDSTIARTAARGMDASAPTVRRPAVSAFPATPTLLDSPPAASASHTVDDTVLRPAAEHAESGQAPTPRRRRTAVWVGAASVALVAAAVVGAVIVAPQGVGAPEESSPPAAAPVDAVGSDDVAEVEDLTGAVDGGSAVFTWTNPAPVDGDAYLWRPVVPGETFRFEEIAVATVSLPLDASGRTCIEVLLVRAGGAAAAEGVEGCAP